MTKNMRFEMRIAEDTLEHLQEVKTYYEKKFEKKFSLAKTIEYAIDLEYLRLKKEEK